MVKSEEMPLVRVGIMSGKEIRITLKGDYYDATNNIPITGTITALFNEGRIILNDGIRKYTVERYINIHPEDPDQAEFTLYDVTIGIGFHWQKKEDQIFRGGLKIIVNSSDLTIINVLKVEDYLISVISSEMSASSSAELLKAHAVISRSWLLAQIQKEVRSRVEKNMSDFVSEEEIVRWYDREDHADFDVCADDHCQRYQGITRASSVTVEEAVKQTSGLVLLYEGNLCDARFSKCCGGITEVFENVWEPVSHPYLQRVYDQIGTTPGAANDLTVEKYARNWILSSPPSFCNTSDSLILSQVLNDYDQATHDFYRWSVTYTGEALGELIKNKTAIDFGYITDLVPVQRGVSGRLIRLRIEGSRKTMIIGKELEIRKALSPAHLYSSAFVVEKTGEGKSSIFTLKGAGWGHGVGLCQIGAAVMGEKGYTYEEILLHYYIGAEIFKKY